FSVGRTASTGSVFGQRQHTWNSSSTVEMADHLFNFCVTHVALRDWVMTTLGVPREDNNFHSVWRAKADGLFGECADIANLSKHLKISKPTGDITAIREDLVAIGMDGEVVKGSAQARDSYQLVRPSGECLDLVTLFHRVCMAWDECFLSDTRLGEPLPSYVEAFVRWQ
ncbi:hypothetical protein, partial [uncultured Pseudomonas sp.]|uniref:hypothetical protein n=1 Tax=uncultured Pseudomonas sp. TaxID=114707 RepID=UPI0030D9777D